MGMHRSGTSIAARILELLGVSLGDPDLLLVPGRDNPTGYWENRAIKELDDELLAHLGGSWDQPPVLEDGWELDAGLAPFRARAVATLAESFPSSAVSGVIGWKDPRLSLLLPFWRTVVPVAGTVVVVRAPDEVARSLRARNGIDAPQSALLWLRYVFSATAADPDGVLLRIDDFFDDLSGTLAAIARHLGLAVPGAAVEEAARSHLDPELRHHVTPSVDADNPLVRLADAVWNGGDLRTDVAPTIVVDAIRQGWLRPPIDSEALARARAQVMALRETVRRRGLKRRRIEDTG
jgi:hypothetical protein